MLLNVSRGVLAYSDFCSAVFSFGYIIIIFKYRSVRGPDLDIRGGGEEGGRGQSPKFGLNIGGRGGAPPWIRLCRRFSPRQVLNHFPPISIGTSWQPKSLSGKRAGHYQRRAGDELMASWHPTMIFLFLSFPLVNAAVRWRNSQWSITHHLVADKHILLLMKSRTFVLFNWCGRLIVACFSKIVQQVKGASAREIP